MTERRGPLPSLTSLRAFAALAVFAHHLGAGFFPGDVNGYGYVGVTFFFVLSGFVLTWSAKPNSGLARFYSRRFFRIYPSHFVVVVIVLAVPSILVGFRNARIDIAQLLLLQAWSPNMTTVWGLNGVTWSLSCEFFFYLLFPVLVRAAWRMSSTTCLVVAGGLLAAEGVFAVIASHFVENGAVSMIGGENPVVRLPEFILGIAVARFAMEGRRLPWGLGAAVLAACAAGFVLVPARPGPDVWFAPFSALLLLFFTRQDRLGRSLLRWRPFVYAGEVSFAFYLVHQLVINNVGPRLGIGWPQAGISFVIATVAAVALHHLVEKPAFRLFTTLTDAVIARRQPVAEPVGA